MYTLRFKNRHIRKASNIINDWPKSRMGPVDYLSFLTPLTCNFWIEMFTLNNIANINFDLLKSLIPFFVNCMKFSIGFVSPIGEFLVEQACKEPVQVYY